MKQLAVSRELLAVGRRKLLTFCLLLTACCSLNCGSVPNLEAPECTAARGTVKEFYSYHFGNDMKFTEENLNQRQKFLSSDFFKALKGERINGDPFTTGNEDYPKAFRVGGCKVVDPANTSVEVLLFWKTDTRSEQKEITAEVVKQGDKWLINKIYN